MTKLVLFLNLIVIAFTLGSYVAPLVNPSNFSFFSIFGLAYPILFFINVFFIVFWLFVDVKYVLLSMLCLLGGYSHLNEFIAFNSPGQADVKTFSIVSYNIGNARSAYNKDKAKQKQKKTKLSNFLSRFNDEDIICFQEVGAFATDVLSKNIDLSYKHKLDKGTVIYSKHPIINKGQIDFGTITNSCLWADIAIGLDTIRVYNIHFQSNAITNDANEILDKPDLNDENTWLGIRGIVKKYLQRHIKRAKQASLVKEHLKECPYPVIVCGDFNDTPLTYTYEIMNEGLVDNFVYAGNGIGTTFNDRIPLLRIDYILTDPNLNIHNFNIIKEKHSDHFPIASQLSFN